MSLQRFHSTGGLYEGLADAWHRNSPSGGDALKGWQGPGPGRKTIDPEGEKRNRVVLFLTPKEEAEIRKAVLKLRKTK